MALSPGARLGPYEITAQIGVGGMGEVYRATDTNLKRAVAIKVLPDTVADDPERLARFQREAEVLASLNHPNIAAIHGLERTEGTTALVMELVEGSTLADRIAQGPIPVDEALSLAEQIAEGLEAAHEQGIIHRDLKPANIKLRADGAVKILDFGLAKAFTAESGSPSAAVLTNSPTLTNPLGVTGVGVILGTAAYMAPEQAKSKVVTRATDIWAFGCVLYEMLTGRAAFPGEDTTDILAAVVRGEPDWNGLPAATPSAIRMLLRRCLRKDPRQRWQHAADVRIAIEEALSAPADVATGESRRASWRWVFVSGAIGLIAAAAVGAGAVWLMRPREQPVDVARVLIAPTPADQVAPQSGRASRPVIAISPDGRHLVFAGLREGQRRHLYLRALDRLEAVMMPGTEEGNSPFFSPDGQWVGFFQPGGANRSGELRKVPLRGGPAVPICQTPIPYGVSWGSHSRIVFANDQGGGLWHVSDGGGVPEPLTTVDRGKGEFSHRLPQVLPGGQAVLFTIQKAVRRFDDTQIVVQSLVTGARKVLVEGGADARYVPSGHLVYARMGTLMAVRFDLERLEVAGTAVGVLEDVMQDLNSRQALAGTGSAQFTVSNTGTLAYLPGGIVPDTEMAAFWVDRTGTAEPLPLPRRDFINLRLSPDGTRLTLYTQQPFNVWTLDLASGRSSPLTTGGQDAGPLWTPDGQRIVFSSGPGPRNLFWMPGDGSGPAQRLTTSDLSQQASSWSPDGKTLAFVQFTAPSNADVWLLSVGHDPPTVQQLLTTPADEQYPEFSPDGRWLAYVSDESGRNQIYVRPYPGPGARHPVSTNGGIQPAWSRKGTELFYTEPGGGMLKMMAVEVTLEPTFTAGRPRMLFEGRYPTVVPVRGYDVTADGRFLMTQLADRSPDRPITQIVLVQNWTEELKRLVPTR